ncbi:MAG: hypothetical protein H7330_03500 [Hymenobacteraceae bacterium]|nr:hypothetical protein [Hymenobacteraceae bacterium]
MRILPPFHWLASTTCPPATGLAGAKALPWVDYSRALLRASFTIPSDPRWASYHSVATTARPSAVAFR